MLEKHEKILVAGARGLVGSAIKRKLEELQFARILAPSRQELDYRNQQQVFDYFASEKPDYVFLAAAKVGGIWANLKYPAQFIYENVMIQTNVIEASYRYGIKKLLFLGSSCIYPKLAPQPMKESDLLTGPLEPTNEPYAVAKICGLTMCLAYNRQYRTNFICAMPTNLYGPGDNFDLEQSHVLPALIRKFHEAKIVRASIVDIWGSGRPKREFLFVDDLADACLFLLDRYDQQQISTFVNIGTGTELTINQLALLVKRIVGYEGEIRFDPGKPDGTPRKLLDTSKLDALGWQAKTALEDGIRMTYDWFISPTRRR